MRNVSTLVMAEAMGAFMAKIVRREIQITAILIFIFQY